MGKRKKKITSFWEFASDRLSVREKKILYLSIISLVFIDGKKRRNVSMFMKLLFWFFFFSRNKRNPAVMAVATSRADSNN